MLSLDLQAMPLKVSALYLMDINVNASIYMLVEDFT